MAKEARIICIGAATQDVFLHGEIFKPHKDPEGMVEEFMLGSKNDVEGVVFATGGGATNAAVTFARQNMHASYLGKIGEDIAGRGVKEALREEGIDTALMSVSHKYSTGYSVLLLSPGGERTILTYRGASVHYDLTSDDFHGRKPDWFYVSSLDGDLKVLKEIVKYAKTNNIKIAFNPGKKELKKAGKLRQMLDGFTLLNLNKEELAMMFDGKTLEELVVNASQSINYVVGTDGPKGCVATDGKKLYKAGMYKDVKVVDRTGAGDAFCSGFTSMIARGEDMEKAIIFASANSTNVVRYIGAKTGILRSNSKLKKMSIKVSDLK